MASRLTSLLCTAMLIYLLWSVKAVNAASPLQDSAVLPLHNGHCVRIYTGNPGKLLTLRLRWDLDYIYIHDSPQPYSDTYSNEYSVPAEENSGSISRTLILQSDIFYIGAYKLRLPVIYGREPTSREETSDAAIYHGSLGLARGSIIWHYWNRFTVSKYALILGDDNQLLDVHQDIKLSDIFHSDQSYKANHFRMQYITSVPFGAQINLQTSHHSNGPVDTSTISTTYASLLNCSIAASFTSIVNKSTDEKTLIYPLYIDLSQDYTYIPQKILFDLKHKGGPNQESLLVAAVNGDACDCKGSCNRNTTTTWISLLSNFFVNPYGSVNNLIEISETKKSYPSSISSLGTQENENTVIILGRIMSLEWFVISVDLTEGRASISPVFDAFPRIKTHPETIIVLLCLLLSVWWHLETHPLSYQWAREVFSKRANIVALVASLTQKAIRMNKQRYDVTRHHTNNNTNISSNYTTNNGQYTEVRFRGQQPQNNTHLAAAAAAATPRDKPEIELEKNIESEATFIVQPYRSFDSESIRTVIWLARIIVLVTIYLAIWGLDSSRFLERKFKIIHLAPVWALLLHRVLLVFMGFISCIVTSSFMKRYPYTGMIFVDLSLLLCVWLNRLPAVCTNETSFGTFLLLGILICTKATEWLISTYIRGCEWLNANYLLEQYGYVLKKLQDEYNAAVALQIEQGHGTNNIANNPLAIRISDLRADLMSTARQARLLVNHSVANRSVSWKVFFVWFCLILPLIWSFFFFANLLPTLEFFFPLNPIQVELAWLFMWCVVVYFAFSKSIRLLVHLLIETVLKLKKKNLQQMQSYITGASATNKTD